MKKIQAVTLSAFLIFSGLSSFAQTEKIPLNEPDYNKPKLFNDLPEKMKLNLSDMEGLFSYTPGKEVSVRASDNFLFEGVVVSVSDEKEASLRSVVINSSNRPGALLTFTRTVNSEGTVKYLGRIISRRNGDAFDITQEDGVYILKKKNFYDLMNE